MSCHDSIPPHIHVMSDEGGWVVFFGIAIVARSGGDYHSSRHPPTHTPDYLLPTIPSPPKDRPPLTSPPRTGRLLHPHDPHAALPPLPPHRPLRLPDTHLPHHPLNAHATPPRLPRHQHPHLLLPPLPLPRTAPLPPLDLTRRHPRHRPRHRRTNRQSHTWRARACSW
jgi:hypothetical protein